MASGLSTAGLGLASGESVVDLDLASGESAAGLGLASGESAVDLDSAPLHLGHGLRPMESGKRQSAFVPARRGLPLTGFHTAHCHRVYHSSKHSISKVNINYIYHKF